MAQVRFLDQVPVGVYNVDPNSGGGTIDIYQDGTLVSSSVPFLNFSGSQIELSSFNTTGVTVYISGSGTGFPFSGSAVITGSLLISGSNNYRILINFRFKSIRSNRITCPRYKLCSNL